MLAVGGLLIAFSTLLQPLALAGVAVIALSIVLVLADWLRLSHSGKLEVTRIVDDKLSLGTANLITLHLRNPSYTQLSGFIRDEYPDGFSVEDNVMPVNMAGRSELDITYYVTPPRRGDYTFGDIYIRVFGPFGVAGRQIKYSREQHIKVYPNMLDMRRYEIGLKREKAVQPGQRVIRTAGRHTDFESLRDYVPDDEFRAIDWKASARRGKLVTRQYQDEKSQNVMLLLDCGRVMGPMIQGLTRLDHAINAAMMLAHVAALKGDRVGLMAFGEDILGYMPPRQGKSQTLNLLSLTYGLENASGDSNYYRAFPYLAKKWTRRSLVAIFTELTDPESSKPLISQVSSLTKKHLCMVVVMSDPAVITATKKTYENTDEVFEAVAAKQVLHGRRMAAAQLARAGAIVLDVPPESFTPAVVNQYLDIKSRARL